MTATLRKFVFQQQGPDFYYEEQDPNDFLSFGKLTLLGDGAGVGLVGGAQRATGFADPTSPQDLATKNYVDAASAGIEWKPAVRAATTAALPANTYSNGVITASANGALPVQDGVTLNAGDTLLVKNEGSALENGPYVVTSLGNGSSAFVLTRTSYANTSAEVTSGIAMFVEEGTTNGNTGWVLTTANPITLGTTGLTFTQFTGLGEVVVSSGLSKSGNTISVALDTGAATQAAGTGGGSSGLEFASAGGPVRAAVSGTGGLQRAATGLSLILSDTTLQTSAAGVSVKGVPAQFQIAGVATSANVTAANENTLVGGSSSNADGLHVHENLVGQRKASGAIAQFAACYYSANDTVSQFDITNDSKARLMGLAMQAIADQATGPIMKAGVLVGALSGATFDTPYFVGSGALPVVAASIPAGVRLWRVGYAKNATDLEISIADLGKRAA